MMEIPVGVPPELVPLSWLIGVWRGEGMIEYETDGGLRSHRFQQTVSFSHDGLPYLNYAATLSLFDGGGDEPQLLPLTAETGFWRLSRKHDDGDTGPGYLPATAPSSYPDAEAVEALRAEHGGFEVQATVTHPTGVSELYLGSVRGPRIDLASDAVIRAPGAKEYSAATRMYGLVGGELLWAWDIAALGRELATHASGKLTKAE